VNVDTVYFHNTGFNMTVSDVPDVETPSGKDAAYENFPVGSWLLPRALRPHIACYYRFARAIDDIADNPQLTPEIKIARLDGFEKAILGDDTASPAFVTAHRMRESLKETQVSNRHCLDLITAFKQDSVKNRYRNWDELVDYCLLSAAPVGRYLIDLHGGSDAGYGPSDALCIVLQIINHLQDCKEDFEQMDRVYIPMDWMNGHGVTAQALAAPCLSKPGRLLLDQVISATAELMPQARTLPAGLRSRRLAMESQAIINIAERLIDRLRTDDPLATRVQLPKTIYLWCCLLGVTSGLGFRASR